MCIYLSVVALIYSLAFFSNEMTGFSALDLQGLDLRVEHTHCFSTHGEGGHYHEDVSPETVVYEGYFTPAERLFRIDRPSQTHGVGRD